MNKTPRNKQEDFELIDKYLAGGGNADSQAAAEKLYNRHRSRILSLLMHLTAGKVEKAEDLLQETFFSAFRHMHTFQKRSAFCTWLYSIAKNQYFMDTRIIAKRRGIAEMIPFEELRQKNIDRDFDIPENELAVLAIHDKNTENLPNKLLLEQAMKNISGGYRHAIAMRYIREYSIDETAERLDVTTGTVKSQTTRGQRRLREEIRKLMRATTPAIQAAPAENF